jgi:5-methylcytosine-specific restriction endonuclease McrA
VIPRRKPLKRSWIRPKPRKARVSWRSGKIRLDGMGMQLLRLAVFARSEYRWRHRCENKMEDGTRCLNTFSWQSFHLHHIVSRGRGGSDTEENTMALCPGCHDDHHRGTWKAERWNA